MALRVSIMKNEVAIGDAINTHVHDGLVAHAHGHTTVASSAMTVLTWVFAVLLAGSVPHVIVVIVILRLAPGTFFAMVLLKANQTFFRTLNLGLFIRLHRLLFL